MLTKANTCLTADTLNPSGNLTNVVLSSSDHWFTISSNNSIKKLFGYWQNAVHSPTKIEVYSGSCSALNRIYYEKFVDISDTINQFVVNLKAGSYKIKVSGTPGQEFWLSAQPEAYTTGCKSTGCNLIGNNSFEYFTNPTVVIPGGQIERASCWDNPSTAQAATPDYTRDPLVVCGTATSIGNRCKTPAYQFETWPNTSTQHGNAHIFSTNWDPGTPNTVDRREYITAMLQDNNGNPTFVKPNRTYYVSLRARNDPNFRYYDDALNVLFSQGPVNVTHPNVITTAGTPQVNFTGTLPYNNSNWRHYQGVFTNDATAKTDITIGNFEDNATTASRRIDANYWLLDTNRQFAFVFIEEVEVIEMPDAGDEHTVCVGTTVELGYEPSCLPSGITYLWLDDNFIIFSPQANPTVVATSGTHTYHLLVTYNGTSFQSDVTVTGVPVSLSVNPINNTLCNGDLQLQINNYNPANFTYTTVQNGFTGNVSITSSGLLNITSAAITVPLGMASITITATNSIGCSTSQTFDHYNCCDNAPSGVPVYNAPFSTANQGTSGVTYIIYGSVALDDSYNFDNCEFYLQPDAELTVDPDFAIRFENCQFASCNEYKWDRIFNNQPSTQLEFENCNIKEALRGVYSESDARISLTNTTFTDNTISQFITHYVDAANTLAWHNNRFLMYKENSITSQHPLSTINLSPITNLSGARVIGIKADEVVSKMTLTDNNYFWSDYSTNWSEYVHVWLVNSDATIGTNNFAEGDNIWSDYSTVTIDNNTFQNSGQSNFGYSGIVARNSTITVTNNTMLDGAGIQVFDPEATFITNNTITGSTAVAIYVKQTTPAASRTQIQYNTITAATAIKIENLPSWPLAGSNTQKVFINDNPIHTTHTSNVNALTANVRGIVAINSPGVIIGHNTLYCEDVLNGVIPDANNNGKAIGILLNNSPNSIVGVNTMDYFGRGLHLEGDASGNSIYFPQNDQYYCNTFASCYHGIYLASDATVSDFGLNTGNIQTRIPVDNIWKPSSLIGPSFGLGTRIWDGRNNPILKDYVHSGAQNATNDKYPDFNTALSFSRWQASNSNNCGLPPSNKTEPDQVSNNEITLYPNPAISEITFYLSNEISNGHFQLYSTTGILIMEGTYNNAPIDLDVRHYPKGMYVLILGDGVKLWFQRFAVQ